MVVVALLALLAVRLAAGPVSLSFLVPTIEHYFARYAAPMTMEIDGAAATWRGWPEGLALSLEGVRVDAGEGGAGQVAVPRLELFFTPEALRHGIFVPATIEVEGPQIQLRGDPMAGLERADEAAQRAATRSVVASMFAELQAPPVPARPLSYLERVVVRSGVIELVDIAGQDRWQVEIDSIDLGRADNTVAIVAEIAIEVGSARVPLRLTGDVGLPEGLIAAHLTFADLAPSRYAALDPLLEPVAAIALPLSGELDLAMSGTGVVDRLAFSIDGGSGALAITEELARALGDPRWAQAIRITSLAARGQVLFDGLSVALDALEVKFAPGAEAFVPDLDHAFPLRSLAAAGRYQQARLDVARLTLDLAGPIVAAQGKATGLEGPLAAEAKVRVTNLSMDDIRRYWPKTVAPGGLEWCAEHLSQGTVAIDADLAVAEGPAGLDLSRFSATLAATGARVDYLPELPPVEEARARGTLTVDRLSLVLEGGRAGQLLVRDGTIVIDDFDKEVERIAIRLNIEGPLGEAIEVLGRHPLNYTQGLGIDPRTVSGEVALTLNLGFPLLNELPLERVRLDARARIRGAAVDPGLFGISVRDGDFALRVNTEGLDLAGPVELSGLRGHLQWEESFDARDAVLTRLAFRARQVPVGRLIALVPQPDLSAFLHGGTVNTEVDFVRRAAPPYELSARVDFTDASVAIPQLGWAKARGGRTVADVDARFDDRGLIALPKVSAYGDGLVLSASAEFTGAGEVREVRLSRLITGRTDLSGEIRRRPEGGWDVVASGISLDLAPLRAAGTSPGFESAHTPADPAIDETLSFLNVSAAFDSVWFGADRSVRHASIAAVREGGEWVLLQADATLPVSGQVVATISRTAPHRRALLITAADAGEVLRVLDVYGDVRGGTLHISGEFNDDNPQRPLTGTVRVTDFRLVRAPLLARLLNIIALTGIVDALQGTGIPFRTFVLPFVWVDDVIEVSNARMHGNALGITAYGTVDLTAERLDLAGTLIPFYFLNAALGNLPVIGPLFSGGEEGGGLFATAYTVKGPFEDPAVSVNPLSFLAPGIFRQVLSWLESLFGRAVTVRP